MKKIIFVVVAISVIVMLGLGAILIGGTPYWSTSTPFGEWQEEITIGFVDGTEQSLKIMQDNEGSWVPLTVKYNSEEISWIGYSISAEVTDFAGYDSVKLNRRSARVTCDIIKNGVSIFNEYLTGGGDITITPNSVKNVIFFKLPSSIIEDEAPRDGTYGIKFTPSGTCTYWGYPDGTEESVSLPDGKTVHVDVSSGGGNGGGGQIVITLSGNVGTG